MIGATAEFLSGGGEMGALMRAFDWRRTGLGPPSHWPQSLRTSVSTCLDCAFPILLWWGPDLIMLYNDEYRTILGSQKHPAALGAPGREIWPEIWDVIGPMLEAVLHEGQATRSRDLMLVMHRDAYPEEAYFSFSYSPIRDETGGVGGVFTPVIETTGNVVGERRLRTLRELAARTETRDVRAACDVVAQTLAENPFDVPFCLIYGVPAAATEARLWAASGVTPGAPAAPEVIGADAHADQAWPIAACLAADGVLRLDDLEARLARPPPGPWPEPPRQALLFPLSLTGEDRAVLVLGVNPRRALDEEHQGFLALVAAQVGKSLAEAGVFEAERRRAEALAEIDRAKTRFFANVSHEFRTPLTLILGPLASLMDDPALAADARERIGLIARNADRLLKLVNTLLDFSRMEASRARADFVATDLARETLEIAGSFREVVEKAGLRFLVDCPPLPGPVRIDTEMWEKIVLNLISNAFKFTLEGEIAVRLFDRGAAAVLTVADTGVGIPAAELSQVFERFHRVEGAVGRTFEGTGIGLALVKELVALHDGAIEVESEVGRGTCFTVTIPRREADALSPAEGARPRDRARAFVQEALGWLGGREPADAADPPDADQAGARVVLIDDNADMRAYVGRILADSGRRVEAFADAAAALDAIRARPPELILSDVMMPGLDGFGLLREIRADPALRGVPVVLLSARAGEEATIAGLEAGADGYLVKPFSARELVARVDSAIDLAEARRALEATRKARADHILQLFERAPAFICVLEGPTHRFDFVNQAYRRLTGDRALIGRTVAEALPEVVDQGWVARLDQVYRSGEAFTGTEVELALDRGRGLETIFVDFLYEPIRNEAGAVTGIFVQGLEVTDRRLAATRQQLLVNELNHRVKNSLFTAQSIVTQTLRNVPSPELAREAIEERIQSLARAHDILTHESWSGADLGVVAARALEPFIDAREPRVFLSGTPVRIAPGPALSLTLALHELATNASKYGALSGRTGRVEVRWSREKGEGRDLVRLVWRETGGPIVAAPTRRGFGTRLLERAVAAETGGEVALRFESAGVVCEITLPLVTEAAPARGFERAPA